MQVVSEASWLVTHWTCRTLSRRPFRRPDQASSQTMTEAGDGCCVGSAPGPLPLTPGPVNVVGACLQRVHTSGTSSRSVSGATAVTLSRVQSKSWEVIVSYMYTCGLYCQNKRHATHEAWIVCWQLRIGGNQDAAHARFGRKETAANMKIP